MKRVLFVINNFKTGGIQKSLVELLSQIAEDYEITVYATRLHGNYVSQIPTNIKVLEGSRFAQMLEYSRKEYRDFGGTFFCFIKTIFGFLSGVIGRRLPAWVYCRLIGKISGNYDVAISFAQPGMNGLFHNLENEIVLYCSKAARKITFLHCDYGNYGGNTPYNHALYKKFDAIAAVSSSVARRFADILPDQKDKLFVVNNCCNYTRIVKMAEEDPVVYFKTCIVSVSRLAKEKGLFRCIPIIKNLINEGFDFEWHIIGGGDEISIKALEAEVKRNGLSEVVVLEGEQKNPYRFIKNADFLFLPSFHEAAPMVFNEACCLGVRILSTNTLSAEEFVSDRGVGVVCNNDEKSICVMLKQALNNEVPIIKEVNMRDWNNKVKSQFNNLINKQWNPNNY
jgi:glycosyltransferase involved in cell wall biosynthesis